MALNTDTHAKLFSILFLCVAYCTWPKYVETHRRARKIEFGEFVIYKRRTVSSRVCVCVCGTHVNSAIPISGNTIHVVQRNKTFWHSPVCDFVIIRARRSHRIASSVDRTNCCLFDSGVRRRALVHIATALDSNKLN